MLRRIDYDDRQYAVYSAGRALPERASRVWAGTFARWAPAHRPLPVLDLGSGTGRFAPLLAEAFGGPVYGVEPSRRMRQVAEQTAAHPGVRYLAGSAERIPLADGTCDVVLLFLVLHHVRDPRAAAAEIRRVVQPGARVLVRSTFRDRIPDLRWHQFFPRARQVEQQLFPSLTEVTGWFDVAGLRVVALDRVRVTMAPSLAAYAQRLRLRAISTFEYLTEDEIGLGLDALQAAVDAERTPQPVEADADLLVLEAPATGAEPVAG